MLSDEEISKIRQEKLIFRHSDECMRFLWAAYQLHQAQTDEEIDKWSKELEEINWDKLTNEEQVRCNGFQSDLRLIRFILDVKHG